MQNLNRVLELIYKKSPFQKKKIEKHLAKRDKQFFDDAEKFIVDYTGYLESQGISIDELVDAYLKLCSDMMKSQIEFMKTGEYTVRTSSEAFAGVYNNQKTMKSYMIGVALSQFLWDTHYDNFNFFSKIIKNYSQNINSYIEIGPGHGLFLIKALKNLHNKTKVTVVDISDTSIAITKSIINHFKPGDANVEYHNVDISHFDDSARYDFITMGEVLEHVDFPEKLLKKLKSLLSDNGRAYVSTCVNCPAIDHVYHFKTINDIRNMIFRCGLDIEDELVSPVENLPMNEIVDKKITINYCTMLKKS